MNETLDLHAFHEAIKQQTAMIFENAAHTQYHVSIPCPECSQPTKWVEGKGNEFRMQPCGHQVPSSARPVRVDADGFLRVDNDPQGT